MEESKKNRLLIIAILVIGLALAGGTFSWLTWRSGTNTTVAFTVTSDFSCSADGGGNITSSDVTLIPTDDCTGAYAIQRTVTTSVVKSGSLDVYMDLWLNVDSIDDELSASENLKYVLSSSSTSCSGDSVLTEGTFTGTTAGDKVELLSSQEYTASDTDTYYLYIWLDSAEENSNTMNKNFELSLGGSCINYIVKPNAPVLDETGMIPVTIANDGTVTTVSSSDSSWYDYEEKQWANAVLVKQTGTQSRSYYLSNTGVEVSADDILAYYVWIPKYKYKIWLKDGTTTSSPQEIDIVFEDKDTVTTGSEVGDYMTHPAFIFGGENLSGIWVGKFETSASPDSTCFETPSTTNCRNDNVEPRILPKVHALGYQYISNQFMTALKFSGGSMDTSSGVVSFSGSTTFGLSNTTNSHMMKNSEWGAVAYLSHSKYGINTEIRINNYWSSPKSETGCGAATSTTTSSIPYGGSTSYPQSTTGNISGVFDMSGGLLEYVMGNYNNTTNSTYFAKLPESKYYDVYSITSNSSCTLSTCGGHALFETASWYSDSATFVDSSSPWFLRGGGYSGGTSAGAFYSFDNSGLSFDYYGFRSVLLANGA